MLNPSNPNATIYKVSLDAKESMVRAKCASYWVMHGLKMQVTDRLFPAEKREAARAAYAASVAAHDAILGAQVLLDNAADMAIAADTS